jgi:small subunit ribosomal protein S20
MANTGQIHIHQVKWAFAIVTGFLEDTLANIKSQIKRNKQSQKKRIRNRVFRGRARTFIQKARAVIDQGNVEEARTATMTAISALDKAAEKGVIHKNNAARRKSRLMKQLATLK